MSLNTLITLNTLTPQQQAFLSMAAIAANQSEQATGVPAAFTLSQAIFESGWGSAMPGNNCFGIKADGHGSGVHYSITQEYLNGQWHTMSLAFESYGTLTDCFNDHARLITQGPYLSAWQAYQQGHDMDAFIRAVSPIYATDPTYAAKMLSEAHSLIVTQALVAAMPPKGIT